MACTVKPGIIAPCNILIYHKYCITCIAIYVLGHV